MKYVVYIKKYIIRLYASYGIYNICNYYLLSHIGKGALQLPEGKQIISVAPIKELPFAQLNVNLVFIFVLCELTVNPRLFVIAGQWMAIYKHIFIGTTFI